MGYPKRKDGSTHKEHRSIIEYRQYVGKTTIAGQEEYVRFTVRVQKNQNGIHNVFVTDIDLYEKPFLDASVAKSNVGARLVEGRVSDAKIEQNSIPAKENAENSDIRTQNFKNWFGDWELAAGKIEVVTAAKEHGFANFDEARRWAKGAGEWGKGIRGTKN